MQKNRKEHMFRFAYSVQCTVYIFSDLEVKYIFQAIYIIHIFYIDLLVKGNILFYFIIFINFSQMFLTENPICYFRVFFDVSSHSEFSDQN